MSFVIEGRLVLEHTVERGQVVLDGDTIAEVISDQSAFRQPDHTLAPAEWLAPGFIDLQINGGFGKEFKTDDDAIPWVATRLPGFGTTSFCAAVTTMPLASYESHLTRLAANDVPTSAARFLGFHLEGPALNPHKVGAQSSDLLCAPEKLPLETYLNSRVRIVTLAPELLGATELIHELVRRGIRVGVGHTTADYDTLVRVFVPDQMMIVHAFNAMDDLNSRKPGVIGAALDRDDFYTSVIADRIHVSDPSLRVLWKSKQDKSRVIGITDGSAVGGLPVGDHQIGGRVIEKRDDRAVLSGTETLVGSTLTLNNAVKNLVAVTGCPVFDAVNSVTRNPATFLGLDGEIGRIAPGLRGDLVILDESCEVKRTFIDGRVAWSQ